MIEENQEDIQEEKVAEKKQAKTTSKTTRRKPSVRKAPANKSTRKTPKVDPMPIFRDSLRKGCGPKLAVRRAAGRAGLEVDSEKLKNHTDWSETAVKKAFF